jgi:hypothetical protein
MIRQLSAQLNDSLMQEARELDVEFMNSSFRTDFTMPRGKNVIVYFRTFLRR